jgi:hypothetical protein
MVSIKVPVIAMSPFREGSLDFEADWAMPADPNPDSLESRPLLMPWLIVSLIVTPTIPPPIAFTEKADVKIVVRAAGRLMILARMTTMAPPK